MKTKLLLLLSLFIQVNFFSQEILEDSYVKLPEQFNDFSNYTEKGNVDLKSGKFGLNIPFYTIGDKYVQIPIGLNYSTSGVKINETSSDVAIGWNLVGECFIKRELKGQPDELTEKTGIHDLYSGKNSRNDSNFYFTGVIGNTASKRGSATSHFSNNFLTNFPNFSTLKCLNLEITTNEVDAILAKKAKDSKFSEIDTERDIFTFSVGERSFKFILKIKDQFQIEYDNTPDQEIIEQQFEAVPLDDSGIKIEYFISNINHYKSWQNGNRYRNDPDKAITKFIVTDKNGVIYTFDKVEFNDNEYIRTVFNQNYPVGHDLRMFQYTLEQTYIGKWHLTTVVTPDGRIQFNYLNNVKTKFKREVPRKHVGLYLNHKTNLSPPLLENNQNTPIYDIEFGVEGFKLSNIEYIRKCKIVFDYDDNRPDCSQGGKNLKQITLKSYFGEDNLQTIKSFTLQKNIYNYKGVQDSYNYRIFLSEIIDSENLNSYKFFYQNPELIPARNQYWKTDLFGYYANNSSNTTNSPIFSSLYVQPYDNNGNKISYYSKSDSNQFYIYSGFQKYTSPVLVKYGTMNKIEFPTKGSLEIEYESNVFFDSSLQVVNQFGPGVRVKKLSYLDFDSQIKFEKKYKYELFGTNNSSGNLIYKPSYAYFTNYAVNNEFEFNADTFIETLNSKIVTFKRLTDSGKTINQIAEKMICLSTHPLGNQSDQFGNEIVYTNVREYNELNNGYIDNYFYYNKNEIKSEVNSFSGPSDDLTFGPQANYGDGNCYYVGTSSSGLTAFTMDVWSGNLSANYLPLKVLYGLVEKKGQDVFPFPENQYFNEKSYLYGKLTSRKYYNNLNVLLKEEDYEYDLNSNDFINYKYINNVTLDYLNTHIYEANNSNKDLKTSRLENTGIYFYTTNSIHFQRPTNLIKKNIKNYFQGNSIINHEEFMYDSQNLLSNHKFMFNDKEVLIALKYPYDLVNYNSIQASEESAISNLIQRNFLDKIIHKSIFERRNGTSSFELLSSEHNEYFDFNLNITEPKLKIKKTTKSDTNTYNLAEMFSEYEIISYYKDMPREIKTRDNKITTLLWDYNHNNNLIAKVENSNFIDIPIQIYNQIESSSEGGTETALLAALAALRTALPNAMITSYTYKPLIGVSTVTDARGRKTTYHYDAFNRLDYVEDHEGNVLSKNEYHYKN